MKRKIHASSCLHVAATRNLDELFVRARRGAELARPPLAYALFTVASSGKREFVSGKAVRRTRPFDKTHLSL